MVSESWDGESKRRSEETSGRWPLWECRQSEPRWWQWKFSELIRVMFWRYSQKDMMLDGVWWDWLAKDNSEIFGLKNSADGTQFSKCAPKDSDI